MIKRETFGRLYSKYNTVVILLRVDCKPYKHSSGWSYKRDDKESYVFLGIRPFEDLNIILRENEGDIVGSTLYESF